MALREGNNEHVTTPRRLYIFVVYFVSLIEFIGLLFHAHFSTLRLLGDDAAL